MAQTNNSNKSSTKDEYFSADNRFQNKDPYDHPSFRKQEDASVFEPHALDSFEEKIDSFFQSEDFSNLSDSLGEAVSKGIETAITGAAVGLSHYSNVLNDLLVNKGLVKPAIPTKDPRLVTKNSALSKSYKGYSALQVLPFITAPLFLTAFPLGLIGNASLSVFGLVGTLASAAAFVAIRVKLRALKQKRLRFDRYISELGTSTVASISDLASSAGVSPERAKEDIRSFIHDRTFLQGRLVENDEIFILDNASFAEYRRFKQEEALKPQKNLETNPPRPLSDFEKSQMEIAEKLSANLNSQARRVPEAIKDRVQKLSKISYALIEQSRQYPENIHMLDRYVDYYLPLSVNLIDKYLEFEAYHSTDAKVLSAKKNIEDSLDLLNQAFSELLNKVVAISASDVNSDISVLQTMLKQEGLLGKDFN